MHSAALTHSQGLGNFGEVKEAVKKAVNGVGKMITEVGQVITEVGQVNPLRVRYLRGRRLRVTQKDGIDFLCLRSVFRCVLASL